ncbi:MAG: Na/Pi cotransporter family protein [Ruminococcaceae bacterium]|nr:Na/Pi cotransporter family protein [Oscillospiraceae bacterium]
MDMVFVILGLIGGLALFLFGMDLMGDGLKKLAGGKLESILARLTSNRWTGLLLGFVVTAVIQSSSATTVMLVGFVNSGIMNLGQTISIIMGANIGTTVTAWLLALKDIEGAAFINLLKPENFTPVLAAIGVIITMTTKSDSKRNIATILLGFSVLIFGMEAMSDAAETFKDNERFKNLLVMFSNPLMGIIVGTIFTAIIQSSSASVGILQVLVGSISIQHAVALPVLLGMNIGTTITPIISAISGNTEAKRVAASCLYIKMIGVIVVTAIYYLLYYFGIKPIVNFMLSDASFFSIAITHTVFNIISTIILMPFCALIEKLAISTIRGAKKDEKKNNTFDTLDERFLNIPSFAVEKCRELVCDMAKLSAYSFNAATELMSDYSDAKFKEIMEHEKLVDKYEDKTSSYLVKIAANNMSAKDSKIVTELLHCIGDIERISDHAVNIAEVAQEMHDKGISFSTQAQKDIKIITEASAEILELATSALTEEDISIAAKVEPLEQVIDRLKRKIKANHISRLKQGDCTMELGFILSDLLTNYERVSDHCSNIAVCIIEISLDSFETHEYLKNVKESHDHSFEEMYQTYKEKYAI